MTSKSVTYPLEPLLSEVKGTQLLLDDRVLIAKLGDCGGSPLSGIPGAFPPPLFNVKKCLIQRQKVSYTTSKHKA